MIIFKRIKDLQQYQKKRGPSGEMSGFVPTMGALHAGHLSLINAAKTQASTVISSIFVNPTQFNDPADFEKYPVTIENDIYLLEKAGCDILFLPSIAEMYPEGMKSEHRYPLGYLETVLEGASRPGHFQGVCQVVERLVRIITPDLLFLGQKDYQQCMVITQLLEIMSSKTQIRIVPTQREADGLAMSSRNTRLSPADRQKAPLIFKTLEMIRDELKTGNLQGLKIKATAMLSSENFSVDYVEIANANSLKLIENWDGQTPLVALIAAFIGQVRLIDNLVL